MTRSTVQIISNLIIISGAVLFISAVILAVLKHKEKTAHQITSFDLKQKELPQAKNKRTHKRKEHSAGVKFSHPEAPYEEGVAKSRDISHGGTGLYVPVNVKIRPGAKIDLEISLEGEEKPIKIMGEVAWTEGLEDEKMEKLSLISEFFARRVGIKFVDIEEEDRQRIKIFLGGLSEKKDV